VDRKMDETGEHHVKWNAPDSERQTWHVFSHMQNLDLNNNKKRHEHEKGIIWGKNQQEGEKRQMFNMIKVHCMYTWKGHNETHFKHNFKMIEQNGRIERNRWWIWWKYSIQMYGNKNTPYFVQLIYTN
jgi:hypothetical protein